MNKAVIAACMGLLVVAGCSKDKKPVSPDAGMNPPPPPTMISPAPEVNVMAPAPMNPIVAPEPAADPSYTKAAPSKSTHATHVTRAKDQSTKSTKSAKSTKIYIVQKGDNLSKIAKNHHTTLTKLRKANPAIKHDGKILVGQKLNLP